PWPVGVGAAPSLGGRPHPPTWRRPPASRKKSPGLVPALEALLRDATAGDPMSGLKWTHKSTRKLSRALRRLGFAIGPDSVARLLREHDFSLRTNRKRLAGTRDPDRD